jgi:hypothetical protein
MVSKSVRGLPLVTSLSAFEAIYHHLPLGLVIPEVPKESFLLGINISYPLQVALDVPLFDSRPKVEKPIVQGEALHYP